MFLHMRKLSGLVPAPHHFIRLASSVVALARSTCKRDLYVILSCCIVRVPYQIDLLPA